MNVKVLKDYFRYCKETKRVPNMKGLNTFYIEHKEKYKLA